jgi:hypothetical protein
MVVGVLHCLETHGHVRLYVVCELSLLAMLHIHSPPYGPMMSRGSSNKSPVSLSTTTLAYSAGVVLMKVLIKVTSVIAFCASRRIQYVMGMDMFALLLVCCCAFIPGLDWSAMMLDECLVGVARCACQEQCLLALCE